MSLMYKYRQIGILTAEMHHLDTLLVTEAVGGGGQGAKGEKKYCTAGRLWQQSSWQQHRDISRKRAYDDGRDAMENKSIGIGCAVRDNLAENSCIYGHGTEEGAS
jgi:hypothetical protein